MSRPRLNCSGFGPEVRRGSTSPVSTSAQHGRSASGSGKSWARGDSGKLQRQVFDLRIAAKSGVEAKFAEHF
jgi:hypothetical protein